MISDTAKQKIDIWIKKYPEGRQSSAVMEALKIVQSENENFLNQDLIQSIAKYLQMPTIAVAEVATFYENYNHQSVGKIQIRFCHNISCMLNGADNLIQHLEKKLNIKAGEITQDAKFSLKKVECLGACVGAPMMQIGDKYYENLTTDKLDEILEAL
jgi:NADH-quinone oxidoreductase subunit E